MNKMKQLALGIEVATTAHKGQFDRGGKPYILHPLHIMNQLMFDPELATIGVLHDVIEDTGWDLADLIMHDFSERVLEGLELLTHNPDESYEDYIKKIASSYDAIRVKRADLAHNSDITRLEGVKPKDLRRMEKYHRAFLYLGEARFKFSGQAANVTAKLTQEGIKHD